MYIPPRLSFSCLFVVMFSSLGMAQSDSLDKPIPGLAIQVIAVGQPPIVKTIKRKASKNKDGTLNPGGSEIAPRDLDTLPPSPLFLQKSKKDKAFSLRLFCIPNAVGSSVIVPKKEILKIKYTPLISDSQYGPKVTLLEKKIPLEASRLSLFLVKEKGTSKWKRFDQHLIDTSPSKCPEGSCTILNFTGSPLQVKFKNAGMIALKPNRYKTVKLQTGVSERLFARAQIKGKTVRLLPMIVRSRKEKASFIVFYHLERPINKNPITYMQFLTDVEEPILPKSLNVRTAESGASPSNL